MGIRKQFEKFLNKEIQKEFDTFIGAYNYSRSESRTTLNGGKIYRNGYRTRKLNTSLGTVTLRIPRTNKLSFIPSFIERYKRNTDELNNLIKAMYVNGVSTAKVNNCTKELYVNNISKSQVSKITNKSKDNIEQFRYRDLREKQYEALYIDATFEKVRIANKVKLCAMITVLGYCENGNDIIAVYAAPNESEQSYSYVLNDLMHRGLNEPKLIISDYSAGLLNAMHKLLPNTKHQRCKVHFMRNIYQHLNNKAKRLLSPQIKKIWHTSNKEIAIERANAIIQKYKHKYPQAMKCLKDGIESTLTYTGFDTKWLQHKRIETTNPIERINKEFKRRTMIIGSLPSLESLIKIYSLIAVNYCN